MRNYKAELICGIIGLVAITIAIVLIPPVDDQQECTKTEQTVEGK